MPDGELFVLPFAKSATTAQHSPVRAINIQNNSHVDPSQDNTQYAFLQMDDRVLVYRGADQPDMSVINPESDVWQRIKVCYPIMFCHPPSVDFVKGPTELFIHKLADSIFSSKFRWKIDSYRWSPWPCTLQLYVWPLEVVHG